MFALLLGGLLGFVAFLAGTALLSFKLLIYPRLVPKLPELILPEPVELELDLDEMASSAAASSSSTESAEWLNALLNWLAANFIEFPRVQEIAKRAIEESVVDLRRSLLGHVLVNSELVDADFGTSTPTVSNIRRLKNSILTCDFRYDGGAEVLIRLHFICNTKVSIKAKIAALSVPVAVQLRERAVYLTFTKEPRACQLDISVSFQQANSAHYTIPFLNRLLSRKIVPMALGAAILRPKTTGFWYRSTPPQPPYPWNPLPEPSLLYTWTPSSSK